ncbi:MAG TPA: HEAT repeat domain-containing protein [Candidatus Polarisedimenticolaceae bacterium]|nr:HEAT repeat domain-containing protein [Candidatus Polarisedimenticolaceae bacterium]
MRFVLLTVAVLTAVVPASASSAPPAPSSEVSDLVEREKVRAAVEAILTDLQTPGESGELQFQNVADRFLMLGPPVIPYLVNELDRQDPATFHEAAYALGHLQGEGVEEALRKAVERLTAEEANKMKRAMKGSAVYALAMHGVPDLLDLMLSGKEPVGRMPWMEGVPLLEIATVVGGREVTLQLLARLDAIRQDPARGMDLMAAVQALAAGRQPEVQAKLLSLLEDERTQVRIGALTALGLCGDPAVVDPVLAHLDAGNVIERQAAADALLPLRPLGKEKAVLARLETETDGSVRGQLYVVLAELMGEGALEAFVSHWKRPDGLDRSWMMRAADRMRSPKAANLLRGGLQDSDARVVSAAMEGLAHLPGPGPADTLLALLLDPREPVSRDAVRLLGIRRERRAGGRIAQMLLQELATPSRMAVGDRRDRFRVLGEALVELQFTAVSPDLVKALEKEQDPELRAYLLDVAHRLDALKENGDDRAKWAALLKSDDGGLRHLARVRLGALGGAEAARALTAAFGRDLGEDRELLGELGRTGSAEAAPLLEKVLKEAAYDPLALRPLRDGAAYGARLLGGPRMVEALRVSVERRQGRDGLVLVYYALLAGKDAVPLLRQVRAPSLTWYEWNRGKDLERLDYMLRRLEAGLPITTLDEAPEYLTF